MVAPTGSMVAGTGSIGPGTGGVFQCLGGAEKGPEVGFVALDIRVERPLVARYAVGLFFWLAGVGDGQLCPDSDFEFVQERVIAGRGAHRSSRRDVSECRGRLSWVEWVTHTASLPLRGARICRSPQCGSRPGSPAPMTVPVAEGLTRDSHGCESSPASATVVPLVSRTP